MTWSPWSLGCTPSRNMEVVNPAELEQSAILIGELVEFCSMAQPGIRWFKVSIPPPLKDNGIKRSTCEVYSCQQTHILKDAATVQTKIFIRGLDALINPVIFVYEAIMSLVVRPCATSLVPSMNCTISGLVLASHPCRYWLAMLMESQPEWPS